MSVLHLIVQIQIYVSEIELRSQLFLILTNISSHSSEETGLSFSVFFEQRSLVLLYTMSIQVELPAQLEHIRQRLAENIHELWSMDKIELDWAYGPVRANLRSDNA